MIFSIIREILSFVISLLKIPMTLDNITFSFYDIFYGLIVLVIAIYVLGKILGGGEE